MTKKQSRRTQRALEKELFERPKTPKSPTTRGLTLEEQIAKCEWMLNNPVLSKSAKAKESRKIETLRQRIRVRDVLAAEAKLA